jgi:hypothetical protein
VQSDLKGWQEMIRNMFVGMWAVVLLVMMADCAEPNAKRPEAKGPEAKKPEVIQWVETETGRWMVHDVNRPVAPVVTPGEASCGDKVGTAPSDAIVLFDGNDLSKWESVKKLGEPAPWKMCEGYFETVKDSGYIRTKEKFGSCQLHIEFATPEKVMSSSQGRGNSGVFLMEMYEIQVLDSYNNPTYTDGQCAALYGQAVPLVNACRKPGEWQSYDIIFHRPTFKNGKVDRKARFTVFHNGVLVHDNVELQGGTGWMGPHAVTDYVPHGDKGALSLQDHGNPVRFRNIWIRELKD